ncbi:unnamed protein product [Parascedosporium putredinis]|uniref:ubiquitinyl hydrolase 1 n=1 Tax=Parascedosporium putredinis TaxID=1442378 RepID=A0A9P1HCE1_9PEZI|nr:unnamed protein product [Parascedosporium putredinis]CAI8004633.1 unnamed protein product [Parascedosporium putredinis]
MLQVLRVTPGFGRELVEWRRGSKWQMPSEPQLMMNIVANLFQWMDAGCFQVMRARTLMEYTEHLTKGGPIEFGNSRDQQDTAEHEVVTMEPSIILALPVTPGLNTLDQLLKDAYSTDPQPVPDYKCDSCKALTVSRRTLLARLPEILIIQLNRFRMNRTKTERGFGAQKVNDFGWGQEFKYRCYGIIVHQGRQMTSGHYYSYVRTEKMTDGSWYHCNDQAVKQIKMTPKLLKDKIYADDSAVPYLLFYQRKRIIGGS